MCIKLGTRELENLETKKACLRDGSLKSTPRNIISGYLKTFRKSTTSSEQVNECVYINIIHLNFVFININFHKVGLRQQFCHMPIIVSEENQMIMSYLTIFF